MQYLVRAMPSHLAVLTPYQIPDSLKKQKVVNLGDGFILRAIERLLGRFDESLTYSPRVELSEAAIAAISAAPGVILAGANQLNDRYTVWPGLTADFIRDRRLRLFPFAIGVHGEPGKTDCLSSETKDVLRAMHENIEYSSWRCPRTIAFLSREMPELSGQLLMTGCPVAYDQPLLEGVPFSSATRRVAVTVTERGDFWERETAVIDFVAREFPRAERFLVLHQNYSPPKPHERFFQQVLPHPWPMANQYQRLRHYAVRRGYRILCPHNADECSELYRSVDLHVGSRLHAHLLSLSLAIRSVLVPVDGRSVGMSEFLGFPLCEPADLQRGLATDFESVRAKAIEAYSVMMRFVQSLPQ